VAVLATEGTIASGAYPRALQALRPDVQTVGIACPLFVPLAEEGWVSGDVPRLVAREYMARAVSARVDTVILGCTHYPLLREVIAAEAGPGVAIVDSAGPLADEVFEAIGPGDEAEPTVRAYTTDFPDRFLRLSSRFLGSPIDKPERIALEELYAQAHGFAPDLVVR
jgi:glutamate racemase